LRIITIDLSIVPFSGTNRRNISKFSKSLSDFSENLRISFEKLLVDELYTNSEIEIKIVIMQSDGGFQACVFNAVNLALIDAGISMKDFIVAADAAFVKGKAVLDLNY